VKAIVHERYGPPTDVLELRDIDEPQAGDGQVVVRVASSSVNPADFHMARGEPYLARAAFGLRAPKFRVPGCDLAGTVESVGSGVTTLSPGDEVFGLSFMRGFGAFAEWAAVPAEVLAPKPANLTFDQAAAVPVAGLTALRGLRDEARVAAGQRVLIIGAAGGVGTFAVQIAKSLGAVVTGVCSTGKVELVRSLGADRVVDYTAGDTAGDIDGGPYDVVFQLAGTRSPSQCRRLLTRDGTLVHISGDTDGGKLIGPMSRLVAAQLQSPFVSQRLRNYTVKAKADDLKTLRELIEAGKVEPVVDRTVGLGDVPAAIAEAERGHSRGKTVVGV
jgi:NADPH:quinone reductase-like Zn-dependent oxidoreductase